MSFLIKLLSVLIVNLSAHCFERIIKIFSHIKISLTVNLCYIFCRYYNRTPSILSAYASQFVAVFHWSTRSEGTLIARLSGVLSKTSGDFKAGMSVRVEKLTSTRFLQYANAKLSMLVILFGIVMLVKPVQ